VLTEETVIKLNRTILASFTILCLFSLWSLIGCKISVKAGTDVIYVPTNYTTIQEAINHANPGDTIFVYKNRTYFEHVVVNKSVSLVGEDRDSTIVDGSGTGNVFSIEANNVSIESFTVRRGDSGVLVEHSSGNDISHNKITDSRDGIILSFSSNTVVSGNTISSNNYYGIYLNYASNNVVSDNVITNNVDGISLNYASNNVVFGNTVSSNDYGISLDSSSNNVILGNTITNNFLGISLIISNNTIYHNNFNNTRQVNSYASKNIWDYGNEGNYWSNYPWQDLNEDGIGDAPYVISGVIDNYPLMGMFSDFPVIHQEETYHVTTICSSTISGFRFEIGPETGNKIIRFNVTGKDGTVGLCRVRIPTALMNYPYIVLAGAEEIVPTILDISNETHAYLYFTYTHSSYTITIISSKTLHLYNELLDRHARLQIDLYNLNSTYNDLLNNYSILSGNYSQLQEDYHELNSSYQEHLLQYSKNLQNIRNLMYILAATTAIFIATTIYLSKYAHAGKTKIFEDKK